MKQLTDKQAQVLAFIRDEIERRGGSPSVREIAAEFGFSSTNAVRCHLDAIMAKGYIERRGREARGIRLTESARPGIPIVGRVAAGTPITAIENVEGYLSPQDIVPSDAGVYCLKVQGQSMVDVGILDGDYVIVRPKPDFNNGEIGVAMVDEEATVKRLRRRGSTIVLVPENQSMSPNVVNLKEQSFRYAGEVVGVYRALEATARRPRP